MNIQSIFAQISITHKLWIGFAIILTLLVTVVGNTLFSLAIIKQKANTVTEDVQPTLTASMELMTELKEAASSLGFFLLTKEELHKNNYSAQLLGLDSRLSTLKTTPIVQNDENHQKTILEIEEKIEKFKSYEQQMIKLTETVTENFVAFRYASTDLNPISSEVVRYMSDMIISENAEDGGEERKELFIDVQELRYTWTNVLNNVRLFLMFGDDAVLSNITLFIEGSNALVEKIAGHEDLLTFEQEDGVEGLRELIPSYSEKLEKLVEIHKGAKARTDSFLIRTEIGPLLAEVGDLLKTLVVEQQDNIKSTSNELIAQTQDTTNFVSILLIVGIGLGCGIAWLTARLISAPLKKTVTAMKDIAEGEGDLTQRLSAKGNDEIAQLAKGFNLFAANIQELLIKVLESADEINGASSKIATASSSAEQSINQQNSETKQISSSVEEMSANAQEVSNNADLAASAAKNADQETLQGRNIVSSALESVSQLADDTQAAAAII